MRYLSTLLLLVYFFQIPALAAQVDCSALLEHIVENQEAFIPWTKLSAELNHRNSATVLIKVPLNGINASFNSLTTFAARLRSPLNFVTISGDALHIVLNGNAEDLSELQNDPRFQNSSFQILGSNVKKRTFSLPLPEKLIEIRDHNPRTLAKLRETLAQTPSERLSILDRPTGEIFFIIGSAELRGITRDLLERLEISYEKTRLNVDVVDWLVDGADKLDESMMVQNGRSWILSQDAFIALKTIEGNQLKLAAARTVSVTKELREELRDCFNPVCTVDRSKTITALNAKDKVAKTEALSTTEHNVASDDLTVSDAELDVLRDTPDLLEKMIHAWTTAAGRSLRDSNAMFETGLLIGQRAVDDDRRAQFEASFSSIDFGLWDGRALSEFVRNRRAKYLVSVRFVQSWKVLGKAFDADQTLREFTAASATLTMQALAVPKHSRKTPKIKPALILSSESVKLFFDFLTETSGVQVSRYSGLNEGFNASLEKVLSGAALAVARKKIADLEMFDSDVNNARYVAYSQNRLIEGIRVLGQSIGMPDVPVDAEYLKKLMLDFSRPQPPPVKAVKIKAPLSYRSSDFTKDRQHKDLLGDGPKALGPARPFALVTYYNTNAWGIIDGQQLLTRPPADVIADLERAAGTTLADGIHDQLTAPIDFKKSAWKPVEVSGDAGGKRLFKLIDDGRIATVVHPMGERWYVIVPFRALMKKEVPAAKREALPPPFEEPRPTDQKPPPVPAPAPPDEIVATPAQIAAATSSILNFEQTPVGRDRLIETGHLNDYLFKNSGYALPAEKNQSKILYNSTILGESVMVFFKIIELRPGILNFKISGIKTVSDAEQNRFWNAVAQFYRLEPKIFNFSRPIVIGGESFKSVTIRAPNLIKLLVKHRFTDFDIEAMLKECRSTVRDGSGYRAEITLNKKTSRIIFAVEGREAVLKTMYTPNLKAK